MNEPELLDEILTLNYFSIGAESLTDVNAQSYGTRAIGDQESVLVPLEQRLVQHCFPSFNFPIGFHHESSVFTTQCFCFTHDLVI